MGVIIILFAIMFLLINKISSIEIRKTVILRVIFALLIQFLFLILYRLELFNLGRVVYFSDAEVYWNHTLSYLSGDFYYAYNDVYIWVSYIVQRTSPFVWVGWINIYNILILNISEIGRAHV